MALTGIYNSSDREMVLTPFQAELFNRTIQYFKTNGVGGDNVFEDTYVLQKQVAEYIKENVTTGGGSPNSFINQIYNGVLGITPVAPPPPPPPSGGGSPLGVAVAPPDNIGADEYSSPPPPPSRGGSPSGGGIVSGGGSPSGVGVVAGSGLLSRRPAPVATQEQVLVESSAPLSTQGQVFTVASDDFFGAPGGAGGRLFG